MKNKWLFIVACGGCLCAAGFSGIAQTTGTGDEYGAERILRMLDERERAFVDGETKGEDLTPEEKEHVQRILRLHALESSKAIETEPAGAPVRAVNEVYAVEELEIQQQENATVLLREMARLRAEVLRLNARVQALEMEMDDTADPLLEEAEPRFYLPVR